MGPEPLPRVVMETFLVLCGLAKRAGNRIDLPHAALADEGGHVVVAEAGADFERHVLS